MVGPTTLDLHHRPPLTLVSRSFSCSSLVTVPRLASPHPKPERPADLARSTRPAQRHERCSPLARETGQPNRRPSPELRRAVEHHERECATSQQDVGAPRALFAARRTHHPERSATLAHRHPVPRRQRSLGVHVRDPMPLRHRLLYQRPGNARPAAPIFPHQLGEAAARYPPGRQHTVQASDPRRERSPRGRRPSENVLDPLPEVGEGQGDGG